MNECITNRHPGLLQPVDKDVLIEIQRQTIQGLRQEVSSLRTEIAHLRQVGPTHFAEEGRPRTVWLQKVAENDSSRREGVAPSNL